MANPNPSTTHLQPYQFKEGNQAAAGQKRKSFEQEVREALEETQCCGEPNPFGWTSQKCLAHAGIKHACKGNPALLALILIHTFGRPGEAQKLPETSMEEASKRLAEKRAKRGKRKPETGAADV